MTFIFSASYFFLYFYEKECLLIASIIINLFLKGGIICPDSDSKLLNGILFVS